MYQLRTGTKKLTKTQEYPRAFAKAVATLHLEDTENASVQQVKSNRIKGILDYNKRSEVSHPPGLTLQGILNARLESSSQLVRVQECTPRLIWPRTALAIGARPSSPSCENSWWLKPIRVPGSRCRGCPFRVQLGFSSRTRLSARSGFYILGAWKTLNPEPYG